MVSFSTKFGEFKLEKLMGSDVRYQNIWLALVDKGLRFVSCGATEETIIFGMDKKQIWTFKLSNKVFFQKASDRNIPAEDFAEKLINLMAAKHPKMELESSGLPTHSLVHNNQAHRILWSLGVVLLDGEKDRLYDDCFEMGDGKEVNEAVQFIRDQNVVTKTSDCKLSKVLAAQKQIVSARNKRLQPNPNRDLFSSLAY